MPHIYKLLSIVNTAVWTLLGLLTIGSIIHGSVGLYINIIIGCLFLLIAGYLHNKAKNTIALAKTIETLERDTSDRSIETLIKRFILLETIFTVLSILFGVLLLTGAITRVFGEQVPVFG